MFSSEQWLANSGADFYNGVATQSLRFDKASTAYLTRTPSSASNRKTWTWSGWVKPATVGISAPFFTATTNSAVSFNGNTFRIYNWNGSSNDYILETNAFYRDSSAWYHIAVAIDTTQGTASNRIKVYINGEQITSFSTETYPSLNFDGFVNSAAVHRVGSFSHTTSYSFDGYMSDVNFIDGLALTPTSFGEFKNGVWIPIDTSGLTFGTNGFRLQFDQVGVGTASASTIGADTSGNTNHWTSSGIVASDCALPDSPENNFCTLNSNALFQQGTLSEGNLKFVGDGGNNWDETSSTFGVSSGKWYWEVKFLSIQQLNSNIAGIRQTGRTSAGPWYGSNTAVSDIGVEFGVMDVNGLVTNSSGSGTLTMDIAAGDVVQFRLDLDDNELSVSVDGDDKGKAWDITANIEYTPSSTVYNSSSVIYNFGQDSSFAGTETATSNTDGNGFGTFHSAVPSGYLALCTANLPEPTIGPNSDTQADDHFNTVLYTGDEGTQAITGVGFQPDWLWIKVRNEVNSHYIFDSSRGVDQALFSDLTSAEVDYSATGRMTAFGTDGFTVETSGSTGTNGNDDTYVAWNWKANGGTTSSNTDGSITSTVQANTDAGFSIVTYTGTGSNATVGHGLSSAPDMFVVKNRTAGTTGAWLVYHSANTSAPETDYLRLNGTEATADINTVWNDTAPTSSVFSIGTSSNVNTNTHTYLSYCFHSVEGYSKFGSYTANNSIDGPFVYTGFKPAFILSKRTSNTNDWGMWDKLRRTDFNPRDESIRANSSNSAYSGDTQYTNLDLVSNGFKIRNVGGEMNAGSGETYIYMAFAESPFKYANAE